MKLPRYKSDNSSGVVSSNRSLTTGTQTGGSIADIGALALSKVAEYGAMKNNHEAKLRRLDINTNKSLSDSMMFGKVSEFENSLINREDFLTPDNWLLDYDTQSKGWEKEFKTGLDEQTWTEYQPLYYQKFFESRNKVVTAINNQKLKNAGHAFNESLNTYNKTLENSTSLREMETAYELFTDIHLADNVKTNLFDTDKFNKVKEETKQYTNIKYGMFQATEGLNIQSPNGSKEIDWNSVTSRLKNKNFKIVDIEGNEVTVDDDLRQGLIKEATELFNTQNGLHTKQKEENDKSDKKDFTNRIISLETGSAEGAEGAKNFMADLEKSNLEPAMKLTLRTAYNASLNNMKNGKNSWNSVQGTQALSLVTYMVGSGAMDTEAERQVIFDLMANGLLKPETALSLYDKSISLTKNRNVFKKDLTTRATSMLMKEIGAGEGILSLLDNIQNVPAEKRTAMLTQALSSGRMTQEAYNAMNNMFSLLAQGERKGFTYENMLVNQRHPNYILNDLISTYKGSMNDARLQELQTRIDGIQGTTATDKTFYIMPTEYFTKKTPSNANMVVPQRLEGEGVLEYVKRAKKLIKRNDNLPSVITGDNIETLDISDLFIMPDFE